MRAGESVPSILVSAAIGEVAKIYADILQPLFCPRADRSGFPLLASSGTTSSGKPVSLGITETFAGLGVGRNYKRIMRFLPLG
jgi:hypothetical protein